MQFNRAGLGSYSGSGGSVGSGANSSKRSDEDNPTQNPIYDPNPTAPPGPTLAEQLAANLAAIKTLTGDTTMNELPSLQPTAQQAPGNVLAGRFGSASALMQNWKVIAVVAVVVVVAFWAWKKYRSA